MQNKRGDGYDHTRTPAAVQASIDVQFYVGIMARNGKFTDKEAAEYAAAVNRQRAEYAKGSTHKMPKIPRTTL